MSAPVRTLTERLAERLARPVDAPSRARARLHLLDWLACVAGARRSDVAAVARAAETDSLARAALLGNLLEMDDVHRVAILHPGPVVWSAALTAAREARASMGALLDAGVRGYEAVIEVGLALDAHHYAHFHTTATAGGFGAVGAGASLFGLAPGATADALGLWGSVAGGLWRTRHEPASMAKAFHVAHAAATGLRCARLAQAGFAGPRAILEGEQGLFAATCAAPRPMPLDAPGWLIAGVSFKPWPACRHAHPAIDAALALPPGALAQGPIEIATYADALAFCDRPEPRTVIEAKFSLQHAVAVVAVRGRPQLADFEPEAIADPALASARARVRVAEDPALTARYPGHFGARVTAGGHVAEAADAWGDPEHPLGPGDVAAKARALFAWGGSAAAEADAAIALTLDAHEREGLAPLLALVDRLADAPGAQRAAA